jgi:hypothetical protein
VRIVEPNRGTANSQASGYTLMHLCIRAHMYKQLQGPGCLCWPHSSCDVKLTGMCRQQTPAMCRQQTSYMHTGTAPRSLAAASLRP